MSTGHPTLRVARAHAGCVAFNYSAGYGPPLPSGQQLDAIADWLEQQGEERAAKLLRDEKVHLHP